jgi:Niemann-Pick C1 protein
MPKYTRIFRKINKTPLIFQIQNNESTTSPSSTNLLPNCITYGSCGDETACVGTHGPRSVSSDHIDVLSAFCPEFLEQHSQTTPVLFCCDFDQVLSLGEKLGLASAIAGKCPSCLRNLRQMLCHLVCSPEQHEFMRVTETVHSCIIFDMIFL